jgi:stress response protein SCP2
LLVCNEQYEFVACSAEETAGMGQQQQTSLFLGRLPKGVYYVYGEIEKYEGGKQVMTVVAEGVVRIMNWVLPERFMEDVLHSYSRKVNTNSNIYLDSERKSFMALRLMYRQLGMAYI